MAAAIQVAQGEEASELRKPFPVEKCRRGATVADAVRVEMERLVADFPGVKVVGQQQSLEEERMSPSMDRRQQGMVVLSSDISASTVLFNLWRNVVVGFKRIYCQTFRALLLRNSKSPQRLINTWDSQTLLVFKRTYCQTYRALILKNTKSTRRHISEFTMMHPELAATKIDHGTLRLKDSTGGGGRH